MPLSLGCRDRRDEERAAKVQRLLASDDRRLTDLVAIWVAKKPDEGKTQAERTLTDVDRAFGVVADEGLAWFEQNPGDGFTAERAGLALEAVGLRAHAQVFADLRAARAKGAVPHETIVALEDRLRALPDGSEAIARWVRAHAGELRLHEVNEKSVPR